MTTPRSNRIYFDSSVYLAFLKGEKVPAEGDRTRVELASLLMKDAEAGRLEVYTSAITIVEVRHVGNNPIGLQPNSPGAINEVFDKTSTRLVEVGRELALRAQELATRYGLSTMDAIHVASAEFAKCGELFMWDADVVRKIDRAPLTGLRVCEPYWHGQPSLGS